MAFVVAITRLAPNAAAEAGRGAEAAALSPLTGIGVYELRVALGGALPLVLARVSDADVVRTMLGSLHARGYGAVACEETAVQSSAEMFSPREFAFETQALIGAVNPATRAELPWADVLAVVAATHLRSETTSTETSQKKFSIGRAALSGGLVLSKTVKKTENTSQDEREPVAYLVHRQGSGHWLLKGSQLRYVGLGDRRAPAAFTNFRTLLSMLREHAPAALHDERLVKQSRRAGTLDLSGSQQTSNTAETDLAVHLIAVAHKQRQL